MNQEYPNLEEHQFVEYVGFWARFAAIIIDLLILLIPKMIISFLLTGNFLNNNGFSNIINLILDWLYFALLESGSSQATLGKRLLDIKVTDIDGNRLSFGRATGRYFAKIISAIILFIGFFMAGFDERKQGLHDKIANTLAVTNRSF